MQSLKDFSKSLISKNPYGMDYSIANKNFWYHFYRDFFLKLLTNYFEWENLPLSIDKLFLEKSLITNGFVGVFEHEDLGLIVSNGTMGNSLDIYDNPTTFTPVNNSKIVDFKKIQINWYNDMLSSDKAIIIPNNNYYSNSIFWLDGFCQKLSDIEQTIQLNRNAQNKPFVIVTDENSKFSFKNLFNKILNGDPVVYVNAQKNSNGSLTATQISDRIHILNTKTDFLLDKLHDEKQRVINQVLTNIGINNNAVDKAERLVSAEATSNNGLINACIRVQLNAREEAVKRINECWGLNINVKQSTQIEEYNTEKINKSIESTIEEETSKNE